MKAKITVDSNSDMSINGVETIYGKMVNNISKAIGGEIKYTYCEDEIDIFNRLNLDFIILEQTINNENELRFYNIRIIRKVEIVKK